MCIAYMSAVMRLFLLLSAFFAALVGGAATPVLAASPVERSASVEGSSAAQRQAQQPALFAASPDPVEHYVGWPLAEAPHAMAARTIYRDRRRE